MGVLNHTSEMLHQQSTLIASPANRSRFMAGTTDRMIEEELQRAYTQQNNVLNTNENQNTGAGILSLEENL
jgi:hypothetical protein